MCVSGVGSVDVGAAGSIFLLITFVLAFLHVVEAQPEVGTVGLVSQGRHGGQDVAPHNGGQDPPGGLPRP